MIFITKHPTTLQRVASDPLVTILECSHCVNVLKQLGSQPGSTNQVHDKQHLTCIALIQISAASADTLHVPPFSHGTERNIPSLFRSVPYFSHNRT